MHIFVNMNVGITSEADPQVDDNMANNYVPRWDGAKLVTGTIFDNGNVGIGTLSPAARLDVNGDALIRGPVYALDRLGIGTTTLGLGISLEVNGNGRIRNSCYVWDYLGIGTEAPAARLDVNGDALIRGPVYALDRLGIGTTTLGPGIRLDVNGNTRIHKSCYIAHGLGIGTESPGTTLQIAGAHPGTRPILSLKNTNAGTTFTGTIRWIDGNGNNGWEIANNSLVGTGYLEFNEGSANRMIIIPGGSVGIGTPSSAAKLDVNGSAIIRGPLGLSYGDFRIQTANDGWGQPQVLILRAADNYTVLMPGHSGFRVTDGMKTPNVNNLVLTDYWPYEGHLWLPRGYLHEGSDSRQKLNQETLDYGLDEALALRPIRYIRADSVTETKTVAGKTGAEESEEQIGFVAQEVYEVIPEAVGVLELEGKEQWCLSYSMIIAVAIKAIQEQQSMINEQKKINAAQEAKIKSLEERITALEKNK